MFRSRPVRLGLWILVLIPSLVVTVIAGQRMTVERGMQIESTDKRIGDPLVMDGLAVFPIFGNDGPGFENAIDLDGALKAQKAVVREVGRDEGDAARVDTLVIENLGNHPIVVLAGTVVKGGKQDRQIGQDFVIAPKSTVDVDAFCVEQGRWDPQREGAATGGVFKSTDIIASSKVRRAAQYSKSQGEVWQKVAEVNQKNKKGTASGTLMATYDAKDVVEKRDALVERMTAHLESAEADDNVVGLAYAVNGKVLGARWFVNHHLFEVYRDKLVKTAAMEAINSDGSGEAPVPAESVAGFVDKMRKAKPKERRVTKGMNGNEYREAPEGEAASAVVDGVEVTADFLAH